MTPTIELFEGAVRANVYLLALDVLLLAHFAYSYYRACYGEGFKVDFWHSQLFLAFVLPILLIYPFAAAYENAETIGDRAYTISNLVDTAFMISVVGYIATYAGFYWHDLTKGRGFWYHGINGINRRLSKVLYDSIYHGVSFYPVALLGVLLSFAFLGFAFAKYGITFNVRKEALVDPTIRPLFNFITQCYLPIVSIFTLIRYLQFREKSMLVLFAIFTGCTVFTGTRGAILLPLLSGITFYLIAKRRKVRLIRFAVLAVMLLTVALYLGDLREGKTSLVATLSAFPHTVAYGNNFSDVRDFAWILTYWDYEYLLGKSYLAALLSFVPRAFSEFREVWTISVYTNNLLDITPWGTEAVAHAGVRPGRFGEPFLNFGLGGVAIIGLLGGYILRYTDIRIKETLNFEGKNFVRMYSHTVLVSLFAPLYLTAGFWQVYVFVAILIMSYFARELLKPASYKRKRRAPAH